MMLYTNSSYPETADSLHYSMLPYISKLQFKVSWLKRFLHPHY